MKVFVAHPYKSIPIDDYRNAFSDVSKELKGVQFVYADEEITSDYILEKIEKMILDADISLFDLTTWNPNVALELGLAYGLRRRFYILFNPTHEAKEVPSDIRGIERIEYSSFAQLKSKITLVVQKNMQTQPDAVANAYAGIKEQIRTFVITNGPVGISQLEEKLSISQAVARPILAELKDSGVIKMIGNKKGAKYDKP